MIGFCVSDLRGRKSEAEGEKRKRGKEGGRTSAWEGAPPLFRG